MILATVSAVAVAVILLGFPLAFLGAQLVKDNELRELQIRATNIARSARETVEMFNPVFSAISRIFGMLMFTPLGRMSPPRFSGYYLPIYDCRLVLF